MFATVPWLFQRTFGICLYDKHRRHDVEILKARFNTRQRRSCPCQTISRASSGFLSEATAQKFPCYPYQHTFPHSAHDTGRPRGLSVVNFSLVPRRARKPLWNVEANVRLQRSSYTDTILDISTLSQLLPLSAVDCRARHTMSLGSETRIFRYRGTLMGFSSSSLPSMLFGRSSFRLMNCPSKSA